MGKYHQQRNELRAIIEAQFRAATQIDGDPPVPGVDNLVRISTDQFLDEFEHLAVRHSWSAYWYGVSQSIVAAFLVFHILGAIAVALAGTKFNVFRVLTEDTTTSPPALKRSQ